MPLFSITTSGRTFSISCAITPACLCSLSSKSFLVNVTPRIWDTFSRALLMTSIFSFSLMSELAVTVPPTTRFVPSKVKLSLVVVVFKAEL